MSDEELSDAVNSLNNLVSQEPVRERPPLVRNIIRRVNSRLIPGKPLFKERNLSVGQVGGQDNQGKDIVGTEDEVQAFTTSNRNRKFPEGAVSLPGKSKRLAEPASATDEGSESPAKRRRGSDPAKKQVSQVITTSCLK